MLFSNRSWIGSNFTFHLIAYDLQCSSFQPLVSFLDIKIGTKSTLNFSVQQSKKLQLLSDEDGVKIRSRWTGLSAVCFYSNPTWGRLIAWKCLPAQMSAHWPGAEDLPRYQTANLTQCAAPRKEGKIYFDFWSAAQHVRTDQSSPSAIHDESELCGNAASFQK